MARSLETQVRVDEDSDEPQRSYDDDNDNLPFSQGIRNALVINHFMLPKILNDEDEEKNSSRKIYLESRAVINRPFCSTPNKNSNNIPASISSNSNESSSPLSQYSEQYKALNNLDFTTAAKILFTDQPKKKFGFDFHQVQLFFVCLPSLAVYLVAQYARNEMKKMDAELKLKKCAEFEAQAKEMESKKAEERAVDPVFMEVKERLDKLEETVKEIVVESKKQSDDAQIEASKT